MVIEYTQKEMRRELKCFTLKKNQLNTKDSNTGNEEFEKAKRHKKNK